ncbi:MAG: HNH endonuclease [Anaerolineae bacterium]|nr:HNH endonuclease [Anaerolineae bacterium]
MWKDELRKSDDSESVMVLRNQPRRHSPGYSERKKNIEIIQSGASGFGVLCKAVDPSTSGPRQIESFDHSWLLRFGRIQQEQDGFYAEVADRVNVRVLISPVDDLKTIMRAKITSTEKDALISARNGQGGFRNDVLARWGNKCAVTGATTLDVIRASHIKPWRYSSNAERLDPDNGLPLIASLDALFDAGFIAFDTDGTILISPSLSKSERKIFNLDNARLAKKPSHNNKYLAFHREEIFRT